MLFITLISIVVAAGVFAVLFIGGNFAVWKYYLDDKMVEQRSDEYVRDFQAYVKNHDLFTTDMDKIQSWISGGYRELVIYKDGQLIYTPDRFEDEAGDILDTPESESDTMQNTETDTEGENGAEDETEGIVPEYRPGDGRNFLDYLNEDARLEYERLLADILGGNRELSPVVFKDGTLLVTVVDYSADLMYSAVFLVSLGISLLVLVIIILIAFSKLTSRITRLSSNVKRVENGQVDIPVYAKGNDEISALAADINSMRHSIVSTMSKEQEAWEANAGLITAMSHDIRTPLTVMMGYLDLIELQSEDESSREYLSVCRDNAIKLKKLSDDMFQYFLVFGKRELPLSYSRYSADEVMHHMLDEHIILLREKGYDVHYEQNDTGMYICVDLLYFGRVVDNLFSNVNKYADVSLPVKIRVYTDGGKIYLEMINKINEQSNAESNEIGLQTCKKIMQQMGGELVTEKRDDEFLAILCLPSDTEK